MRAVFVFDHFGPYHFARVREAAKLPGWKVTGVELHPRSRTYGWEPGEGRTGAFRKISLPRVELRGLAERRALRPHLERVLGECGPDVVFVNGWGDFMSLETIAWARRAGVRAVVMSETRRVDGARSWWGEWVKSRIVGLCDAGLCGGESHRRYLGELGLAGERVVLGYNAVDNDFFAAAKKSGQQDYGRQDYGEGSEAPEDRKDDLTTKKHEKTRKGEAQGGAQVPCAGAEAPQALGLPDYGLLDDEETSELGRDSEITSPSRFASGPAGAAEPPMADGGELMADGSAAALHGEPLRGGSGTGQSPSLQIGTKAPEALALDAGRWSLDSGLPARQPYFLASNRFIERKNLGRLIRAYARYCAGSAARQRTTGRQDYGTTGKESGPQWSNQKTPRGGEAGIWPLVLLGDGELRGELEGLCGSLGLRTIGGTTNHTKLHERGEAGPCLDKPSGAAFSNPFTSELARDSENTSLIRSASGPALAAVPPGPDSGGLRADGAQHGAGSVEQGEALRAGDRRSEIGDRVAEGAAAALDGEPLGGGNGTARRPSLQIGTKALDLAAQGAVVFAGFRQIDELPAFYGSAGAFIHPALAEPWGLVINEAMASGLPILSSNNVGAAEELVREGVNGFLFDPEDVEEMAGLMGRVAGMSREERLAMGEASRRLIAEWGPERFAQGAQEAARLALAGPAKRVGVFDRVLLEVLIRK